MTATSVLGLDWPVSVMGTMTEAKSSDELYNEQRRQRAAELIAAIVRKRRRLSTDEALLDQEALRAAAERADSNGRKHAG